jgi:hypothetical protein
MKLTIGPEPCGAYTIQFTPDTDVTIDIQPNAVGETVHLYATIETDGQTFEGRLFPQTGQDDAAKETVTVAMPRETWDFVYETLSMDAQSSAFDQNLRVQIAKAREIISQLNPAI